MKCYLICTTMPSVPLLQTKAKNMRLSRIKITKEMADCLPRADKLKWKYLYYKKKHAFESTIILDKHYMLIDGYTTYLLARMLGMKKIEVYIRQ